MRSLLAAALAPDHGLAYAELVDAVGEHLEDALDRVVALLAGQRAALDLLERREIRAQADPHAALEVESERDDAAARLLDRFDLIAVGGGQRLDDLGFLVGVGYVLDRPHPGKALALDAVPLLDLGGEEQQVLRDRSRRIAGDQPLDLFDLVGSVAQGPLADLETAPRGELLLLRRDEPVPPDRGHQESHGDTEHGQHDNEPQSFAHESLTP